MERMRKGAAQAKAAMQGSIRKPAIKTGVDMKAKTATLGGLFNPDALNRVGGGD
jgi:hypothetical protein